MFLVPTTFVCHAAFLLVSQKSTSVAAAVCITLWVNFFHDSHNFIAIDYVESYLLKFRDDLVFAVSANSFVFPLSSFFQNRAAQSTAPSRY